MNIVPFSQELARSLYDSDEQFPVSFDDAWQWLEYGAKSDAKVSFKKSGFVETLDYRSFQDSAGKLGGRPVEKIQMSCECFKQWAMMSGTTKGKEIRLYFLECERIAKAVKQKPQSQLEILLASVQQLVEIEHRQRELEQQNAVLSSTLTLVREDVKQIQERANAAEKELKALPPSSKECPKRTARTNINTLIRSFCHANNVEHRKAWNDLYREFRDRCHIDLKIRAANGKCAPLDLAETLDVIEDLYAVAKEIFNHG
jgi:phage anti-repressor protein